MLVLEKVLLAVPFAGQEVALGSGPSVACAGRICHARIGPGLAGQQMLLMVQASGLELLS